MARLWLQFSDRANFPTKILFYKLKLPLCLDVSRNHVQSFKVTHIQKMSQFKQLQTHNWAPTGPKMEVFYRKKMLQFMRKLDNVHQRDHIEGSNKHLGETTRH